MSDKHDAAALFRNDYKEFLWNTLRSTLRRPSLALIVFRMIVRQKKAMRIRRDLAKTGIRVPQIIIASITNRCNLLCKGCYSRVFHRSSEEELSSQKLKSVFAEAAELGVSIIIIGGGEPLNRPEILEITRIFPEIVFPIFTNGTLINEQTARRLNTQRHVVSIISMEGNGTDTNERRGRGVYERIRSTMEILRRDDIFFGTSLTVTGKSVDTVLDKEFIEGLTAAGCQLFFFIDYVPVEEGTECMTLTDEQKVAEARILASYRKNLPDLFVAFPFDEDYYGGCLAAGRGVVHINPEGRLEPCPFSPYSDVSLKHFSLQGALQSPLLRTIRENHQYLKTTNGGCPLWENRNWIASAL